MRKNSNMSSNLWIVDDPFIHGHFLGYLQDHTYGVDYPVIFENGTLRICTSPDRTKVAVEIEIPGEAVQMLSGFLSSPEEIDNTKTTSSWGVIVSQVDTSAVGDNSEESNCFYAILLKTDDGFHIQCLTQNKGDGRAYNRVELGADFKTEISRLIQICDMGDPDNPLIVGLDDTGKILIAHNSDGTVVFKKEFEVPMLFSTVLSPGIRFVGFDGNSIIFLDIDEKGFEQAGNIKIEADSKTCFFDSIKSHKTENPLFCFYDGKNLNYIDLFEKTIQNSIEVSGVKPGLDSTCFPCDDGLIFIQSTVVSPEEILIRQVKLSDTMLEPIFRLQLGSSYDGGLYGFKKINNGNTTLKIFHVHPGGKDVIEEYTFENIEGEILSIDFDKKTKKVFMFTSSVYFETEPLPKWANTNVVELTDFE